MLVLIYMMALRGLESGGGSLLRLKGLVCLTAVEEGVSYVGSHDHVCIVFEPCECIISLWMNEMVKRVLMID